MPLVLIFGTVAGLHLSMAVYFFLGFWGMYQLLKRLDTNLPLRLLLSYIWTFSGFPALHLSGGHLTFAVYLLAPWVLLTFLNIRQRRGWLWFGLMMALIFNTAIHYVTIQLTVLVAGLAIYEFFRYYSRNKGKTTLLAALMPYIKAGCLMAILVFPKAILTLQFTHEFPRTDAIDDVSLPAILFINALTSRNAVNPKAFFPAQWSWTEYGDFIGIITTTLTGYMLVKKVLDRTRAAKEVLLVVGMLLAFLLYLGSFSKFSPYYILHLLPVFTDMRVPSRYIGWFVLGAIVLLGQLPKRKFIYGLLTVAVLEVFTANYGILNSPEKPYTPPTKPLASFQQYAYFDAHGVKNLIALNDFRLLRATQSNYGEVYGYEPLVGLGEYYRPITIRCGVNQGCDFVISHNAHVVSWSPNKIVLQRTGNGPIELSMNPGKVWNVNGKNVFPHYSILEMGERFLINDPSKSIVVTFTPRL